MSESVVQRLVVFCWYPFPLPYIVSPNSDRMSSLGKRTDWNLDLSLWTLSLVCVPVEPAVLVFGATAYENGNRELLFSVQQTRWSRTLLFKLKKKDKRKFITRGVGKLNPQMFENRNWACMKGKTGTCLWYQLVFYTIEKSYLLMGKFEYSNKSDTTRGRREGEDEEEETEVENDNEEKK